MTRAYRLAIRTDESPAHVGDMLTPEYIGQKLYRTIPAANEAALELLYRVKTPVAVLECYNGGRWGKILSQYSL